MRQRRRRTGNADLRLVGSLAISVAATALAACGDDSADGGGAGGAAGGPVTSASNTTSSSTASSGGMTCGNGTVEPGEACDGTSAACSTLGGSFTAGNASCRGDCSGWDVSSCTVGDASLFEVVKPGEREMQWADARCNDGTPFAFSIRPAPGSHDWMIYLQGGVFCDDNAYLCSERAPPLTTTLKQADSSTVAVNAGGLMSVDPGLNPDFAGANLVFAHYCSSDFWAGATTDLFPTTGMGGQWYFSGHRNVEAMLEILAERYGLDDARPDLHVLWSGGSAGGFGTHLNASRAEAALPATKAGGRLQLLVDAGWWIPWDDSTQVHCLHDAATCSDRDVAIGAHAFWGASFDPDCEAAEAEPADCLFGGTWYPHVSARVPVLVQQSREDAAFAQSDHGLVHGDAAMDAWHAAVEASLEPVERLFSGAEPYHTLGSDDPGLFVGPPKAAFGATLGRFWAGGAPERVLFAIVPPAVVVNQGPMQSDPTNVAPIRFRVDFSEPVTGFDASDVSLAGSTVGGTLTPTLMGSGSTYLVSVTGMSGSGTVVATVPAASATDALSHGNEPSVSSDNTVSFGP